jgi:hypothetical protein
MGVGLTVAIAGQGMALSSDYIIRVAPGLSAKAANANASTVADRGLVLSLIVGVTALVIAYVYEARRMRRPSAELLTEWESGRTVELMEENEEIVESEGTFHEQEALAGATVHASASSGGRTVGAGLGRHSGLPVGEQRNSEPPVGHGPSLRGTPIADPGLEPPVVENPRKAAIFAILVPVAYLALIAYMLIAKYNSSIPDLQGGDAAALVGGIAAILLFLAAVTNNPRTFLEKSASHVVDGLVFAFKAMGVVIPIAGFFFIGNGDFAGQILGLDDPTKGPAFLYDLVNAGQAHIPHNSFLTGFGVLIIGMIAGLEGSGFSGLPLTGSLAGSLGPTVGMHSSTLAAIGQMGNIWSGGGTLVAWSSLIAVAGFARVGVVELARKCFIPVVTGLAIATVFAVIVYG